MKNLIFIFLLFLSIDNQANDQWNKYYALVRKDIAKIEALKSKDLSLRIRLFELYGEKLSLLLEKENELRIQYIANGKTSSLDKVIVLQKNSLKKIEYLAKTIERQTNNKQVLTKISYYRSLNYYLVKDYSNFYKFIKKAESTNTDKKLGVLIYTKLADYHYNEHQYKEAVFYYQKLISETTNSWVTKFYYNLAWSELKLGKFDQAIAHLKLAKEFEEKKGYFKIGDQLTDAFLLFFAFSKKTVEGIEYFRKYKMNSFDNLLKFLHYVFENGDHSKLNVVINEINNLKLNLEQEMKFLEKKIIILRPLKKYTLIQKEFVKFRGNLKSELNKESEIKDNLKTAIIGYTGFLQELVKSRSIVNKSDKIRLVNYIATNFNLLRVVDPANSLEYSFYEGETYFSIKKFQKASYVYANGLSDFKKKNEKPNKYVAKTLDSLFKSLEYQGKPNSNIVLFSLTAYLHYFPKGAKARGVHQRLVNFHQVNGNTGGMLNSLRDYNQAYPADNAIQKDYYKSILNKYIDKKDISALKKLKSLVDKGFLGFTSVESANLTIVINQLYFYEYENLAKQGKFKEAIKGFQSIVDDKAMSKNLRDEALKKKLYFLYKDKDFSGLADSFVFALSFLDPKEKDPKQLIFYAEEICVATLIKECQSVYGALEIDKDLKPSQALENINFKLLVSISENFELALKKANTPEKKSYLFKVLMNSDSMFSHKLYELFYREPAFKVIIQTEIERRFLNSFYSNLSFNEFKNQISKTSISELFKIYTERINKIQMQMKLAEFKFTKPPEKAELIAEEFGAFGMAFNQQMTSIITNLTKGINEIEPDFLPYFLSKAIKNFRKESEQFKKFIPVSKDADLEAAMNDELSKLHQFLDQKIIEFQQIYFKSIENCSPMAGAKKYRDEVIDKAVKHHFEELGQWQN